MKVGDLTSHKSGRTGLIVDIVQKKCWRTNVQGKKIDWNKVEPEPHVVILFSDASETRTIPMIEFGEFK
tara:strand:- start:129 stop:335 length:207 start_codon:yes stop_codon:yes gene_type:complete